MRTIGKKIEEKLENWHSPAGLKIRNSKFKKFPTVTVVTIVTYWYFGISDVNVKKIEVFINMRPYVSQKFEMLLPLQLWFFFNNFYEYSLWHSSHKWLLGIMKVLIFFTKDCNSTFWLMGKFQNSTPPTIIIVFQPHLVVDVPCDRRHKIYLLGCWQFKFLLFFKALEIFVNVGPCGSEIFTTLLYSYDWLLTKLFRNVPYDSTQ